jgi:hypothetical protein
MYLHTHWQAYRVRMITAAAARGILEPVGTLLKELKKSGMDVQLPDFEIESENKGVRRKSTFRLIDGQVKPVEEIEEEIEEKSWWQEWKSGEDSGGQLRDWESAGGYYGVMSTT